MLSWLCYEDTVSTKHQTCSLYKNDLGLWQWLIHSIVDDVVHWTVLQAFCHAREHCVGSYWTSCRCYSHCAYWRTNQPGRCLPAMRLQKFYTGWRACRGGSADQYRVGHGGMGGRERWSRVRSVARPPAGHAANGHDASMPDRSSILDSRPHESGVELNQVLVCTTAQCITGSPLHSFHVSHVGALGDGAGSICHCGEWLENVISHTKSTFTSGEWPPRTVIDTWVSSLCV